MRTLSLSPLTVLPCTPLEQIDAALVAGFDAISLRLFPVMDTDIEVMADAQLQRDIQNRLAESRLSVFDVEVVRVGPDTDIEGVKPALEFAASLGANRLAVTSLAADEYDPRDESDLVRKLVDLSEAAAARDVGIMLEFIPFRGINSLQHAIDVVTAVGHPGLGVTVDALHFHRSGGAAAELAGVDRELLACAQLCDAPSAPPVDLPFEARYGRLYPGEGGLPLADFIRALPEDLQLCVEVPSQEPELSVTERAVKGFASAHRLLEQLEGPASPIAGSE